MAHKAYFAHFIPAMDAVLRLRWALRVHMCRPASLFVNEPRDDQSGTEELREMLRDWRMEQVLERSPEEGQRAFRVFHDTTLDQLCEQKPRSKKALSEIPRFGENTETFERYGRGVLEVIDEWAEWRSARELPLDEYSYEDEDASFGGMLGESSWAKILWVLYDSFSDGDSGVTRRQVRELTGCDAKAVRSVLQRMEGLGFFNTERGDGEYLLDPIDPRVKRLIMGLSQLEGGHREKAVQRRIEHFEKVDIRWIQWDCADPHCDNNHCFECGFCGWILNDGHDCKKRIIEDREGALWGFDQLKKSGMLEGNEAAEALLKDVVERVEGELEEAKARVLTKDSISLILDAYLDVSPMTYSPTPVSRAVLFEEVQLRGFSGSSARFSQILTSMKEDGQITREETHDVKTGRRTGVLLTMDEELWQWRWAEMERALPPPGTQQRKEEKEEITENNPRAYEPWEVEEDDLLRSRVAEGWSVKDLVEAHGRQPGGIRSRILKLGLEG